MSFGQYQVVTSRPSSITKLQTKLLQMETEALKQGLAKTHLTPDRVEVALSVMLTKEVPEPLRSHSIKFLIVLLLLQLFLQSIEHDLLT